MNTRKLKPHGVFGDYNNTLKTLEVLMKYQQAYYNRLLQFEGESKEDYQRRVEPWQKEANRVLTAIDALAYLIMETVEEKYEPIEKEWDVEYEKAFHCFHTDEELIEYLTPKRIVLDSIRTRKGRNTKLKRALQKHLGYLPPMSINDAYALSTI